MEALLPSEIARLVLGYLQEQCAEAAKVFIEKCPSLQECRIVVRRGGRYSTKVGGFNLVDILDKYCAAYAIVQDKLHNLSDCEQIKNCNDLIEQLHYLLDGSRSHRFVVNISVPSQNSPSKTPFVIGNSKKKQRISSEKSKRIVKSFNNNEDESSQNPMNKRGCVETTGFESSPRKENDNNTPKARRNFLNDESLNIEGAATNNKIVNEPSSPAINRSNDRSQNNESPLHKDQSTEPMECGDTEVHNNKCSAETSTDELQNYATTELQTFDIQDLESDITLNSAENLSLFTKKLLERQELIERIAENACKAIRPAVTSEEKTVQKKTENADESLLTEFDNAVKSAVETTQTDPAFETFLQEIFSASGMGNSPDEDSDSRQNQGNTANYTENVESIHLDVSNEANEQQESMLNNGQLKNHDVPLKQRLRSSSKSINNTIEEEDKESNSILENQNAEAVMNIVNVIANRRNSGSCRETHSKENVGDAEIPENSIVSTESSTPSEPTQVQLHSDKSKENKSSETNESDNAGKKSAKPKKKAVRKKKSTNPVSDKLVEQQILADKQVETLPTLVLCPESEVEQLMTVNTYKSTRNYIPIAPRLSSSQDTNQQPQPQLFLKAVNVPRHLVNPTYLEIKIPTPLKQPEAITLYAGDQKAIKVTTPTIGGMPVINLDESTMKLTEGTGLSPFFKNNLEPGKEIQTQKRYANNISENKQMKGSQNQGQKLKETTVQKLKNSEKETLLKRSLSPLLEVSTEVDVSMVNEIEYVDTDDTAAKKTSQQEVNSETNNISKLADSLITKRTPKSLLRSRSKNNRLSLSTPRRRNSHVRALDFSTPVKGDNSSKSSATCTRSRSVCRAGLFSPPLKSPPKIEQINKPIKLIKSVKKLNYQRVPIATRSPTPKLQGNWGKVTGIGMIIGETSGSSPEKSQEYPESPISDEFKQKTEEKKSWDSDLRKIVGTGMQEEVKDCKTKNTRKSRKKSTTVQKSNLKKEKNKTEINHTTEPDVKEKSNRSRRSCNKRSEVQLELTPPTVHDINDKENDSCTKNVKYPPRSLADSLESHSSLFLELETPVKTDVTFEVPPTPIIMKTPGDCMVKNNINLEMSVKSLCSLNTPVFPPITPSVIMTPKLMENDKKPSPYYEPSEGVSKKKDNSEIEEQNLEEDDTKKTDVVSFTKKEENNCNAIKKLKEKDTSLIMENKNDEPEETGKEEISENLEAEILKAVEESDSSKNNSKEIIEEDSADATQETNFSNSDINDDSSDSDSSSSSSTSSSSSSSTSSSDSSTSSSNNSSPESSPMKSDENVLERSTDSSRNDLDHKKEAVDKDNKNRDVMNKELLKQISESEHSEESTTYSPEQSSRRDSLTNHQQHNTCDQKLSNVQTNSTACSSSLISELEEKRLRVLAKFKESAKKKSSLHFKKAAINTRSEKIHENKSNSNKTTPKKKSVGPTDKLKLIDHEDEKKYNEVFKSKVDQVKRDIFCHDENNEQRTTRSQTARRNTDQSEDMPGVLECLKLMPTSKNDTSKDCNVIEEEMFNDVEESKLIKNVIEEELTYDDSKPIKKRKHQYKNLEFETNYSVYFHESPEKKVNLIVSELKEIYNSPPKNHSTSKTEITSPQSGSSIVKKHCKSLGGNLKKNRKRKGSPIKDGKIHKKGKLDALSNLGKTIQIEDFLKLHVHVPK